MASFRIPHSCGNKQYFSLIGLMAGRSLTFPLAEWLPFGGGLQNPPSALPLNLSVLASSTKQSEENPARPEALSKLHSSHTQLSAVIRRLSSQTMETVRVSTETRTWRSRLGPRSLCAHPEMRKPSCVAWGRVWKWMRSRWEKGNWVLLQ